MKILPFFAALILSGGAARAVPYTDIYDIFQGGYDIGGSVSGFLWHTDVDGDGFISEGDKISGGGLSFNVPDPNGPRYGRGFDIAGAIGPSLLSGSFTISGINSQGGILTITNTGGRAELTTSPFDGGFIIATTIQAPVITRRVPDGGSALLMLSLGLLTLRYLASRRSGCRW